MKQTPIRTVQRRGRLTRWLHLLVAIVIVHQMVMSAVMQVPNAVRGRVGNVWWEFHEYGGLTAFVVLLLFWLWSLFRDARETRFGEWFPWFSSARRAALWRDVTAYARALPRLQLPAPETETPLASMVQGLGLVLVSVLAASGTTIWLAANLGGSWPAQVHWVRELHGALGNVVWYYLAIHAGAAVAHEFFGHRLLRSMAPID